MAGRSISEKPQVAALPYRFNAGVLEILLITSRNSGRWVIPKGGTMKKLTNAQAAAVEAFEEAGVKGAVSKKPLGVYSYVKPNPAGAPVRLRVSVYAMAVTEQAAAFKEQGQRTLRWMRRDEAAAAVAETKLSQLIATFEPPPG